MNRFIAAFFLGALAAVGHTTAVRCAYALPATHPSALAKSAPHIEDGTSVIRGRVIDTLGVPIVGAMIYVASSDTNRRIVSLRSQEDGSFLLANLPDDERYTVAARAMGFVSARADTLRIPNSDTLIVTFRLVRAIFELTPVEVGRRNGSTMTRQSLSAKDINTKHVGDAFAAIIRYGPLMLGDSDRCLVAPGRFVVDKIFVGGVRRDVALALKNPFRIVPLPRKASVSPQVLDVLDQIPAADIEEIKLVDCNDKTVPLDRRNALYVSLKAGKKYGQ